MLSVKCLVVTMLALNGQSLSGMREIIIAIHFIFIALFVKPVLLGVLLKQDIIVKKTSI